MIKNKYKDLIEQTFYFPRLGFSENQNELYYEDIRLMDIIERYGTPLKVTYLPKIGAQIQQARSLFDKSRENYKYRGNYTYCYCTKSSHFSFIMDEVLSHNVDLETSSAFDLEIIFALYKKNKINKSRKIICNGYKTQKYIQGIVKLMDIGFTDIVCVLDNVDEIDLLEAYPEKKFILGIRIATEEEPNFSVYTSRLGISSTRIHKLYNQRIKNNPRYELRMLHFFVNSGIRDTSFYWSELTRLVNIYCDLKEECNDLKWFDIGGGMPIYNSLGVEHNYSYMISEIVRNIKKICDYREIPEPDIFTEFGSYTVGESGFVLYEIIGTKQQNDKELWYIIDSSFITTLPDTWGIGQKFILLAINYWNREKQKINLGGLTCDGMDYYNSDSHSNQVFLPKYIHGDRQYMGFFHTGAYQESLGGYGGIQHCLIPAPRHILISKDVKGKHIYKIFSEQQQSDSMLKILGYPKITGKTLLDQ